MRTMVVVAVFDERPVRRYENVVGVRQTETGVELELETGERLPLLDQVALMQVLPKQGRDE